MLAAEVDTQVDRHFAGAETLDQLNQMSTRHHTAMARKLLRGQVQPGLHLRLGGEGGSLC